MEEPTSPRAGGAGGRRKRNQPYIFVPGNGDPEVQRDQLLTTEIQVTLNTNRVFWNGVNEELLKWKQKVDGAIMQLRYSKAMREFVFGSMELVPGVEVDPIRNVEVGPKQHRGHVHFTMTIWHKVGGPRRRFSKQRQRWEDDYGPVYAPGALWGRLHKYLTWKLGTVHYLNFKILTSRWYYNNKAELDPLAFEYYKKYHLYPEWRRLSRRPPPASSKLRSVKRAEYYARPEPNDSALAEAFKQLRL